MKKLQIALILCTFSFMTLVINSDAQSVIQKILTRDHSNNETYQVFKINSMKAARNDGKYEKALLQNDVIGNDYNSVEKIYGRNANADGSGTSTNYVPVDGYKRTFCGALKDYYYSGKSVLGVEYNVDKDFGIEIIVDSNNSFLKNNEYLYDLYKKDVASFFQPWNIIEGEINVTKSDRDHYPNPENVIKSDVCIYGPWVFELYDPSEHGKWHANNNEIHPIEQYWYKDRAVGIKNSSYNLNFFVDNSGRFDEQSDYYRIPQGNVFKPWSKAPLDGNFYMAFDINLKRKDRLTYWIEPISHGGVNPTENDGKLHYLIYQNDTLITINENADAPEYVNINFENIGFTTLKGNRIDSSSVRGFIKIKSRITGSPVDGNLRLRVEKATTSASKQNILLTILKIKRLHNNSFRFLNTYTNKLYTDPAPVDTHFDEKQVFLSLSNGSQLNNQYIKTLEGEYSFDRFSSSWEGILSDNYNFNIVCRNGYSGKELGSLNISGDPKVLRAGIEKTILLFSLPDESTSANLMPKRNGNPPQNPQVKANLFELTYKIEIIPQAVNRINTY